MISDEYEMIANKEFQEWPKKHERNKHKDMEDKSYDVRRNFKVPTKKSTSSPSTVI